MEVEKTKHVVSKCSNHLQTWKNPQRLTLLRMLSVSAESPKGENFEFDLNCSLTMNFVAFLPVVLYQNNKIVLSISNIVEKTRY